MAIRRLALACLVACSPAVVPAPAPPRIDAPAGLRLPRVFQPTGYRAELAIADDLASLRGKIAIAGELAKPSATIWLNAAMPIDRALAVRDDQQIALAIAPFNDRVALTAAAPLPAGRWTIVVAYHTDIPEHALTSLAPARGAFRERVGRDSYVFTMAEPNDARRTFPCVDEPDVKVPWTLALEVPAELTVAGNAPIASEIALAGGRKRVELAPTAPLPSYLVAFAVGPFEVVDVGRSASGVPVRVLAERDEARRLSRAPRELPRQIDVIERYTGIRFPYPKLDLVAVPRTAVTGWLAMENAGIIMIQANAITTSDPEFGRYVVAHELSHHWFGDLVTLAWWDDIWLNEAFADWMASKVIAELDPSARLAETKAVQRATFVDLPGAVRLARDTDGEGDTSTAEWRGELVLDMLERYLGPDTFRRAIHGYLAAHANANATSNDLIAALDAAAGRPLDDLVRPFLIAPAVPEISFTISCGTTPALAMSSDVAVPLCVAYDRDGARGQACGVADGKTALPLPATRCPRWVMPYQDGIGVFHSRWTVAQADAVLDAWPQLSPAERAVTLGELYGYFGDDELWLGHIPALLTSGDRASRSFALAVLWLAHRLAPDDVRPRLDAWIEAHVAPDARSSGFRFGGDALTWPLRLHAVQLAVAAHDPEVLRDATALLPVADRIDREIVPLVLEAAHAADPTLDLLALPPAFRPSVARALSGDTAMLDVPPDKLALLGKTALREMFSSLCESRVRDRAVELAAQLIDKAAADRVGGAIDGCVQRRDRRAPAIRALASALPR
ncbi:MAG TPA: M1 family aminopeptidase [Kofleriaceae bacterium]|nr:M1 family aminopeptidase [Kofleriaceae bacterium]